MIRSKADYIEYVKADNIAMGVNEAKIIDRLTDRRYRFVHLLRKVEYLNNCRTKIFWKPLLILTRIRYKRLGMKCGYSIPINVFGKGLSIAHLGTIVVNPHARVGENCRIHVGTNIGTGAGSSDQAPYIGNNVYIGPGAKIFGKITIADDIAIGANAVVNHSFTESGITVGGIPAVRISDKGSIGLIVSE